ncbi:MAG: formate--tetrahydrofolate ligase [Candidatus Delongbacteria bacterium]|nr:formate--tetrahydrofolate ligase [Candidatus Delongbacteria bacterium]
MKKNDLQISHEAAIRPIAEIGESIGIRPDDLIPYGRYKAKIPLDYIKESADGPAGLILVSAITPTPAGEGKTTVSVGLAQALNRLGKKTIVVLREPSLGPIFGIKGGATGGGYSQVIPMEDINLHFTGDFAAVEKAHNLLAALIDNNLQSKTYNLNLDPRTIHWRRVLDMNDRSLRKIIVGLGGTTHGVPRETGFDITAASEVMAILCLADGIKDLKKRLGRIFVGYTVDKKPVYAEDLNASGAMATLLKDAVMPNLVQTLEGGPAIIHGGPFANIAHGCNSILATRMGLSLGDYVVTEAGFGFDLGAEKFFDIKCRYGNLKPRAAVLVATVRALKMHGGAKLQDITRPDPDAVRRGLVNLDKHIENMNHFAICPIIAVNRFESDTDQEIALIRDRCRELGVRSALCEVFARGGEGGLELAEAVLDVTSRCSGGFTPLYDWNWSIQAKVEKIAKTIYGASAIDYAPHARNDLKTIERLGLTQLPVCIAKTQKSLSDDPNLLGRPKDFLVTVREIEIAAGAGFVVPITGEILRMPGLPEKPAAVDMDIDDQGNIVNLF